MTTKICPICYQLNSSNGNFCMWCGTDLSPEEMIDREEMSPEEWLNDIVFTAAKIQKIKAKQLLESFNKKEILASDELLLIWWLTFNNIKVKMEREEAKK